ncbi:NADH dehydrogenase [Actinocorallia herbida]|uniref:NADH:ubiquinone reductase (non-electrogenic) n=1 Tax=Actinocorallia herbida TaxID=58109 RepID=A0A3N1CXJ1_9ACTN|nr:NAD(P)/FAD-dependent oxidoreductase [Actinocorallia herbida]ROO85994.1 NADH dehydrogenase [Actinocorallia herbida]
MRWVVGGGLAGLLGGAVVCVPLAAQEGVSVAELAAFAVIAVLTGCAVGWSGRHRPEGMVALGVLLGLLAWFAGAMSLERLAQGGSLSWSLEGVAGPYPRLIAGVLAGGLTGLLAGPITRVLPVRKGRPGEPARPARVVIVGGGFGGVAVAQRFERLARRGAAVDVTLVSDSPFLLFTPMLAEVAGGALEAQHIGAPVRACAPHTRFRRGEVVRIDAGRKIVVLRTGGHRDEELSYDHLVIATGVAPAFFGLPGVEERAFTLKTLGDAARLRAHVLALLDLAEQESDPRARRRQLSFVVAGGGFAGAETVAELFDLVHGVLRHYPGIDPAEPAFTLVHSGDGILPEMPASLGAYARERLEARGIRFRLGVRVAEAADSAVWLTDRTEIPAQTLVWTAGNKPGPLLSGDRLKTDAALRVDGAADVWAVGDCARIPDPSGAPYPPTAQHALREGRKAADNIGAVLAGREPEQFVFRAIGILCLLGHRTAAAEIRGLRLSGLAAWFLWRGIYLAKLPGADKRVRVLFDWSLDLVFPRDLTAGRDA